MIIMNRFSIFVFFPLLMSMIPSSNALAENCYIAKEGFAVTQPYMVTRGCFLFSHAANIDLENQSDLEITRPDDLHPDPIHSEFLRFILDRKLISLKKGTPLFSCDYDLQTIARDYKLSANQGGTTRILGYDLPQFNCAGTTSIWAPVRPVNESKCFWVAVPLIRCDEIGSELNDPSEPDQETKEQ